VRASGGSLGAQHTLAKAKHLDPDHAAFSVTVGTVMERSHIPLSKWVMASHLMVASKKGSSAHELHRMLDTSYEAAWFLFHRLREAALAVSPSSLFLRALRLLGGFGMRLGRRLQ